MKVVKLLRKLPHTTFLPEHCRKVFNSYCDLCVFSSFYVLPFELDYISRKYYVSYPAHEPDQHTTNLSVQL